MDNHNTGLRLHRLADLLFIASVERNGLPATNADASELAEDCYRAAQILIAEGWDVESAVLGAQKGLES